MKVAIYSRSKQLAVRKEPGGAVVGTMRDGEAAYVEDAGGGWLKLASGGFVRADLVTVGELPGEQPAAEQPTAEVDREGELAEEQPQAADEPTRGEQPAAEDGEDAALMAMRLNDLRELAKNSGVQLPKNATKAKIVELLLSDE